MNDAMNTSPQFEAMVDRYTSMDGLTDRDVHTLHDSIAEHNPLARVPMPENYPECFRMPFLRGALQSYFRTVYRRVLEKSDAFKQPAESPQPQ